MYKLQTLYISWYLINSIVDITRSLPYHLKSCSSSAASSSIREEVLYNKLDRYSVMPQNIQELLTLRWLQVTVICTESHNAVTDKVTPP